MLGVQLVEFLRLRCERVLGLLELSLDMSNLNDMLTLDGFDLLLIRALDLHKLVTGQLLSHLILCFQIFGSSLHNGCVFHLGALQKIFDS